MLKQALARLIDSPRVARALPACPDALFVAWSRDAGREMQRLQPSLKAFGLRCDAVGNMIAFIPADSLIRALNGLCRFWSGVDIQPTCFPDEIDAGSLPPLPCEAGLCLEHRALLREFAGLPSGLSDSHRELAVRGLRLIEGPPDTRRILDFQKDVRQAAAVALRERIPADGLCACAYIIVTGGMVI